MENQPENLGLKGRLKADTPLPFKILQLIGIAMIAFSSLALLYNFPLSSMAISNIGIAGTVIAFGTPFIVKDVATLKGGITLDNINKVVTDLLDQYHQVKDVSEKPFVPEPLSETIDSIKEAVVDIATIQETTTTTTTQFV